MKKRLLILMTVTGMIILLGGLLTYGLGVHEIIPVPRPDLIVVGTSLIGILLIVSGVCDLFVKKTKEMEIEENDERNISLSNAAMASGFKVSGKISLDEKRKWQEGGKNSLIEWTKWKLWNRKRLSPIFIFLFYR